MGKLIAILIGCFLFITANATSFYVSSTGNDAASGQSPAEAWLTIGRVNTEIFHAGDTLAFEGGSTFTGSITNMWLSWGDNEQAIVITSYGTGKAIINSGIEEGISFGNPYHVTVTNISFRGSGYKVSNYWSNGIGMYVTSNNTYQCRMITIDDVDIAGYGGWGIMLTSNNDSYGFSTVSITNAMVHNNGLGGISTVSALDTLKNAIRYVHSDVYVANCKAYDNLGRQDITWQWSGTGIILSGVVKGMIEYCEAYNNGVENGDTYAGPIGIFVGDCKYVTIQYCVSHHNRGGPSKRDGGGFDLDLGTVGCVIQYCESYENDGAGYALYQAKTSNILTNDTIRYNKSTNDGRNYGFYGALSFWGAGTTYKITNSVVYGNTITLNKPGYGLMFISSNVENLNIYDNSFCLDSSATFVNYLLENPIPAAASVFNNTFPCTVQPQQAVILPVAYRGAFSTSTMWNNWMNTDPVNTSYGSTDSVIQTNIKSNRFLSAGKRYLLKGTITVTNNAVLTIQAGTLIRADNNTSNTALIVSKGARIVARGTSTAPVVFTSNQAAGQRKPGDWAGIYILGKASYNQGTGVGYLPGLANSMNTAFGENPAIETDSSGVLQYVRIEFAGAKFANNAAGDGLTFAAAGRGTLVNNVQVSYSGNNAFKFIGGTVNCRYIEAYKCMNANWDVSGGYHGVVQFALGVRDPLVFSTSNEVEGLQSRNDSLSTSKNPLTSAFFCNLTEVGPLRGSTSANVNANWKHGVRFSNNSRVRVHNSIVMDYPSGVDIDGVSAVAAAGSYNMNNTNGLPGNLVFKNNLLAGIRIGSYQESDQSWDMRTWFFQHQNDSLTTTAGVLTDPYKTGTNNAYTGDFRPGASSPALTRYNWNDSSFYYIDSTGKLTNMIGCPPALVAPSTVLGAADTYPYVLTGDTAMYYLSSRTNGGILRYNWVLPAGANLITGQGTDTIVVKFDPGYTGGTISVRQQSYCGLISGARNFLTSNVIPVTYTFTGDGNWTVSTNWLNNLPPPAILKAGSKIIISPSGTCILNTSQTISPGATFTVTQDKNFIVPGNLIIK